MSLSCQLSVKRLTSWNQKGAVSQRREKGTTEWCFMVFFCKMVCFQWSCDVQVQAYFSALCWTKNFSVYWTPTVHWKSLTVLTNLLLYVHGFYRLLELDVMLTFRSDFPWSLWALGSTIFGSHISLVSTQQNGCDRMKCKNSSVMSRPACLPCNKN